MKMNNIHIWFVLPNLKYYHERCQTFINVASHYHSGHIVIVDGPDQTSNQTEFDLPENVNLHFIGGNKLHKLVKLWQLARDAINSDSIIIHDTFWSKLGFFVFLRNLLKRKTVRYFLSLYSPNPDYYFKRRWRQYTSTPTPLITEYQYFIDGFKRIPLEFLSCKLSDAIIGNADEIAEGVKKYYSVKSHLFTLPTSVDPKRFQPKTQKNNLSENNVLKILGVGSLHIRKGWHILVEAVHRLNQTGLNVQVLLIFTLRERNESYFFEPLKKYGLNHLFTCINFQKSDKLIHYYNNADVLVHPPFPEGSPRVIKEALACGCPVIASDISGIRLLDPSGTWIQRFQTGNPKSLEECLRKFWNKRNEWIHKKGDIHQWVLKTFSPPVIAKKIIACHDQVISSMSGTNKTLSRKN